MAATLRLKQLLFIAAALALVSLGLVAALSPASPARADDTTCEDQVVTQWFETDPGAPWVATNASRVKTEGTDPTYTDWVNEGEPVRTETNVAPGGGDLVQYVPAGTVDDSTEGHWDNTVVTFYTWTGGNSADAPPVYADATQTSLHPDWNRTNGNPQGGPHAAAPPLSPYEAGNGPNTASWFLKAGRFVPGVEDTDYLWQKQVRTPVPGTDDVIEYEYTKTIECPPPGPDCEANPQAEGCPPVPCEETDTCPPPVEKPWICHPVNGKGELGNGWNLINPNDASSHIIESEYPDGVYWEHMSNDGLRHDVYADLKEGEDGKDQSDYTCPGDQLTEVTPHAEGQTDDCDPDPFGTITVTAMEGVTYTLQDGSTVEGTIAANGTNTVTAHLAENYVLAEGAVSEWVFTSDPAVDCPAPPAKCPDDAEVHAGEVIPEGETEETYCNEDPAVCPDDAQVHAGEVIPEGETEETYCNEPDPGPETCPEDTDKAGQEIPEGENADEFCDDDDEEEVCPDDTDKAGETIPEGENADEFCNDDDVNPGPNCDDDPSLPGCDENKPPVVVPDDSSTPSNGPTVKGAQATAPTKGAGAVAGTPAARVPTAIDAGLAPQQRDTGGGLGLLGIAAAFLGAALVGLTVRPRRRIGATSRART